MIIIMIDEALCCTRLREMVIIILVDEALCCTRLNCIMVIGNHIYIIHIYVGAYASVHAMIIMICDINLINDICNCVFVYQ